MGDLWPDYIIIFNTRIERPSIISPKQWLDYWDNVLNPEAALKRSYNEGYLQGEQDGKDATWDSAYQDGYEAGQADAIGGALKS